MNCVETTISLLETMNALNSRSVPVQFFPFSYPYLAELRNMFLTYWYDKTEHTHLLFIDADMDFRPEMVLDMLDSNLPLVGAMYVQKKYPLQWVGNALPGKPNVNGNFIEREGIGCGVTLIHRSVITAMLEKLDIIDKCPVEKYPGALGLFDAGCKRVLNPFDPVYTEDGGKLLEDLAFCHRARQCGVEVWAAMGYDVSHIGAHSFTGNRESLRG